MARTVEIPIVKQLQDSVICDESRRRHRPVSADDPIVRNRLVRIVLDRNDEIRHLAIARLSA